MKEWLLLGGWREGAFFDVRPIELSGPRKLVTVLMEVNHPTLLI